MNQSDALGGIPQLGYFVLDVLRWVEQMPSILNVLNNTGAVGWREFWDRDFTRDEVREVLEFLAERGLVTPYTDSGGVPTLVPVDIMQAKCMDDEDLWWRLEESGLEAWESWEDYPTSD